MFSTIQKEKHHESGGWIAVDLDGTLAHYDGWNGKFEPEVIGAPIPRMVERVQKWIREGQQVRIFTARISYGTPEQREATRTAIQLWCGRHIGKILEVTCAKDIKMIELWDDRCVQVERNTGVTIADKIKAAGAAGG